jgi:hypothetical protein
MAKKRGKKSEYASNEKQKKLNILWNFRKAIQRFI